MNASIAGQVVWVVGILTWYVIRRSHERKARRVGVVLRGQTGLDRIGLGCGFLGLAILPAVYVATGIPEFADRPASYWLVVPGAAIFALAVWLFRWTHKTLGRNWSITLEIREAHKLVCEGPYASVRHPMYTSFLLMGLAQALLLANWVAGLAGLVGFLVLFVLRVDKEERMMLETFGEEYRAYMARSKRLVPGLY